MQPVDHAVMVIGLAGILMQIGKAHNEPFAPIVITKREQHRNIQRRVLENTCHGGIGFGFAVVGQITGRHNKGRTFCHALDFRQGPLQGFGCVIEQHIVRNTGGVHMQIRHMNKGKRLHSHVKIPCSCIFRRADSETLAPC